MVVYIVILAHAKQREEDHKFDAALGYKKNSKSVCATW
jgi:hypothetical protein